jgi:transcriptional regulator with XRE-family HTH domain
MSSNRKATKGDKEMGERIKAYRVAKKISQEALGAAVGVSFQMIQKYEHAVCRVSADRLVRIAAHLDVNMNTLLGVKDSSAPNVDEIPGMLAFISNRLNIRLVKDLMRMTVIQRGALADFVAKMQNAA